ncbi:hypothetical protein [Pedobacter sp. PACM 27299]|uniref:hypothetical protein n=1 Tax=Pedobacter sp. PACM 27299 TaxID=1727164 RepID=UPI000AB0444F|nr:hypothetical protein [Pedobacter sp. PACM 27299]
MPQKENEEKVQIVLTAEQIAQLSTVFGEEIVSRIESIEIEKLAGYLKANASVN